jgi:hypothetical protein
MWSYQLVKYIAVDGRGAREGQDCTGRASDQNSQYHKN